MRISNRVLEMQESPIRKLAPMQIMQKGRKNSLSFKYWPARH